MSLVREGGTAIMSLSIVAGDGKEAAFEKRKTNPDSSRFLNGPPTHVR